MTKCCNFLFFRFKSCIKIFLFFLLFCSRFVKFSMPNIPDFETLFSQVQLFISTCNGEHIRYATDTCKSSLTKPLTLRCLGRLFIFLYCTGFQQNKNRFLHLFALLSDNLCHSLSKLGSISLSCGHMTETTFFLSPEASF